VTVINKYTVGLLIILSSACSSNPEMDCEISHKLIQVKPAIEFGIDAAGLQYAHDKSFVYEQSNLVYYVGLDEKANSLDMYDLLGRSFFKRLKAPFNNRNGIKITDFYIHNLDSIFLYSDISFSLQLINVKGDLIEQYNLREDDNFVEWFSDGLLVEVEGWESRIQYDSVTKKILIPVVPNLEDSKINTMITYSIERRKFLDIGALVPPDIVPNELHPAKNIEWYSVLSFDADKIVSSHYGSSFLSVGTLSSGSSQCFCRPSNMVDIEDEGEQLSIEKKRELIGSNGMYLDGFYAPYKSKYIVAVRNKQSYKNSEGLINNVHHADISILVLNDKFEVEKEMVLQNDLYNYKHIYPMRDKILVLKENPNDLYNSEDTLYFSLFDY
jgi:hypothetical protein